jgi:Zinc carboxypeptidase
VINAGIRRLMMKVGFKGNPSVRLALAFALAAVLASPGTAGAQQKAAAIPQKIDAEYTAKIKEYTQDPRIITELVDHMPASDVVPSPLKFLGRIPGTPDELTYYKDIVRYFEALDKASPRVSLFRIGKSEEGRDMILVAIADEATIKSLDKYKAITAQLGDPRKLTEAQARQLIATGKPIYHATGNLHSGETGSAEMLMELGYRLAIEETPFIQQVRNNVIFLITPVLEVDGREKQVDTFYYRKKTKKQAPPMVYWGKYVAHDDNRDGMGQALMLTRNIMKAFLEWHPTVLHDLHESVPYLYTSTGAGPYNISIDPVVTDEWWMLSKYEVSEMTKRGVPGVWTGGFYDGWVPNYLFFIANTHNSIGRFYETQSYGPGNTEVTLGPTQTSKEWYRPNPPLPKIKWGPRNNVNMQESALLFALQFVAKNKELFLENFYLKGKRSIERGKTQAPYAWVIPAAQRRRGEAADLVNTLRRQGVEVHAASAAFAAGGVKVNPGDYIIRQDQPYSRLVDALLDTQFFSPANPSPYDDTGWSLPLLRNVTVLKADDKAILDQPMTPVAADAKPPGTIAGTGNVLIVDHNGDNALVTFRFANRDVKMRAAEEEFEAAGRKFQAGAFIIPNADLAKLEPSVKELGLTAHAVSTVPAVKSHDLDVPRIGYVHSWQRTQDEGWVRIAFDNFNIPYTYFGDQKLREGNLRAQYDVIVFPHVGGTPQSQVNGMAMTGPDPVPYKKSELTPNLGVEDSTDDVRGGMGLEGLANLVKFVEEGGLLIVEGSTSTILPAYGVTSGINIETPTTLVARGSVLKAEFADKKSPIAYGYDGNALAVYFSQSPVISAGGLGGFGGFGGGGRGGAQVPGVGQNLTPNAVPSQLATLTGGAERRPPAPQADETETFRQMARAAGISLDESRPRVVLRFPANPDDMLLSGMLVGGQALSGRAVVVDASVGKGHVVMFANRPYWRWQTQGSFFLGFNAILNWNDLDAGKEEKKK